MPSFKLNFYYSIYFNTVRRGLLKAFMRACMRTLLAYVIDGGLQTTLRRHSSHDYTLIKSAKPNLNDFKAALSVTMNIFRKKNIFFLNDL